MVKPNGNASSLGMILNGIFKSISKQTQSYSTGQIIGFGEGSGAARFVLVSSAHKGGACLTGAPAG